MLSRCLDSRLREFVGLVVILSALGIAGCKPTKAMVSGTVSLGGQPVTLGDITFAGSKPGEGGSTPIQPDGKYSISLPPGTYKITVAATPPPGATGKGSGPAAPEIGNLPKEEKGTYRAIPKKYSNAETSGLSVTVTSGKTEYNITMQ